MLQKLAIVFGTALVALGILGFVPGITANDLLFGVFEVNGAHNIIHLASGAAALWAGMASMQASKKYFQIFGIIYGVIAVLGMFNIHGPLLGFVAHNGADLGLHVVVALIALYAGFGSRPIDAPETAVSAAT